MWWVDLAWPLGLVVIGAYNWLATQTTNPTLKAKIVCIMYMFQGGRMALGAIWLITSGRWSTKQEIGRYVYQKIKHEKRHGEGSWTMMHIQKEIFLQCYTNFCLLIVPIALVCNNTDSKGQFRILEVVGILMWICSYLFESVADSQKM